MSDEVVVAPSERSGWLRRIVPVALLAVFCAALWAIHREISHFNFSDFRAYVGGLSWKQLSLAIAATLCGYATLLSYDWFALRYIRQKLAIWHVAITAFIGYAFSMNIGQAMLSGGAVRMRIYTGWGIGAGDVTRIIGFNFVIGTVGQMLTAGLFFVVVGVHIPASLPVPFHSVRWLGFVALAVVLAFFLLVGQRRDSFQIKIWRVELPPLKIALPAVVVSGFD